MAITAEENGLLTEIEGDAPMGRMMRQHWVPALLSEQVAEPDGPPVRVRLFGENLVAFRDSEGRVGLLDELCPHRRASLFFGRNEECGLRCLYHGWKIDVAGNVVDAPSEPRQGVIRGVHHLAYPTVESGGFVWAYMNGSENAPEFVPPPWAEAGDNVAIARISENCNWAQALEGAIDSAHTSSLHSSLIKPGGDKSGSTALEGALAARIERPSADKAPRIEVEETDFGFRYVAIRKPLRDPETTQYLRITSYIAPFVVVLPPQVNFRTAQVFVPVDNTHSMFHFVAWSDQITLDQDQWRAEHFARIGPDLDENFVKKRTLANNYLQDRSRMKAGHFTGIDGAPNEDMAMQESMGPIVDRTKENLSASDIAIARFRRIMLAAVRDWQGGSPAIGCGAGRLSNSEILGFDGLVPKTADWRSCGWGRA
ncbi:MAG: MarR family transcriptional regulator [Thermoleophilia bacterium]|nr:MarR family transcriptional regulator [Thermoleophilia bacterium]